MSRENTRLTVLSAAASSKQAVGVVQGRAEMVECAATLVFFVASKTRGDNGWREQRKSK